MWLSVSPMLLCPFRSTAFHVLVSSIDSLKLKDGVLKRLLDIQAACHTCVFLAVDYLYDLECLKFHVKFRMDFITHSTRRHSAPRRGMRIKIELDLYCYVY
jgi:hypothetical protein